ncbi:MAG: tRNA uridine-5-carboxymethylaminomethyl(34) synthesis enzyme MnmG [Clostridia bacterium]|nr:tRNA uridine-5-carboxymethylaminomethyl(34) synthesis enzyme MnmG [Clostridia bacterium]
MYMTGQTTQIAVIGAGHAGIEAALASARMGLDTVLFTMNLDAVGNMPCNPSIGGTGKGHLVYEIAALGGEMGRAADAVTLQSRTLNLGKGAAVHSKRVQADRSRYRELMKQTIEQTPHLRLLQAEVVALITEPTETGKKVVGVKTKLGDVWHCEKVIISAGTFLDSRIFVGHQNYPSGPDGMLASEGLSASLREEGLKLMRFKTGTPARIHRRSIDFSKLNEQKGEETPIPFSTYTDIDTYSKDQVSCYIVYTNEETHRVILEHLHDSAMYSGQITGTGPRYCPSIEDKLVRFADKPRHQLFVEPCGANTDEMYLQGFSTSMPTHVQELMIRTLEGFENAEIMRYAYAIEYDCADPTQMYPTLAFKSIEGLYGAGQFNGTSGYEEAAAQGLIAGINAALSLKGKEELVLPRDSSYIGTLIDDLVTKGTNEPYRMMTSRSEYRLLLRQDNADLRLSDIGYQVGLLPQDRYDLFCQKRQMIEDETARMEKTIVPPHLNNNEYLESLGSAPLVTGVKLSDLLRRPELTYENTAPLDPLRPTLPQAVITTVEMQIKYDGYIKRQMAEAARREKLETRKIPDDIDYMAISGLRIEAAQKLTAVRPLNIGQASRISGVSPADISVLLIYLKS